jgi:hypothetical protein
VIFPLLVCYLARAEQVEVERAAILAVVLDEYMKFRKHMFDQRRVAVGMIGLGQNLKLAGIVHEVVKCEIAGCEELVERGRVAVLPPG